MTLDEYPSLFLRVPIYKLRVGCERVKWVGGQERVRQLMELCRALLSSWLLLTPLASPLLPSCREYLTGFHKRKVERKKAAIEEIKQRLKQEQKKLREEVWLRVG